MVPDWFFVRTEWATPPLVFILILHELPFLVALALLARKGRHALVASGAGISFGAGLFSVLLVPVLYLAVESSEFLNFGGGPRLGPDSVHLQKSLPFIAAIGVFLIVVAWRKRKYQLRLFRRSVAFFLLYLVTAIVAGAYFRVPATPKKEHNRTWLGWPMDQAYRAERSIAACLIRHKSLNPRSEFPRTLDDVQPDWGCDMQLLKPQPVEKFSLTYAAKLDPATGRRSDFRVTMVPLEKGELPVMIDSRGVLFTYSGMSAESPGANQSLWINARELPDFRGIGVLVKEFKREHAGRAPGSLGEMYESVPPYSQRTIAGNTLRFNGAPYVYQYSRAVSGDSDPFSISQTCTDYGHTCILSFFLDENSVIHMTAEPRPATPEDSVALPCQIEQGPCQDVRWDVPKAPSTITAWLAYLRHELNYTQLWFPSKNSATTTPPSFN